MNIYQPLVKTVVVITTVVLIFWCLFSFITSGSVNFSLLIFTVCCALFNYRLSAHYKDRNSFEHLIKRQGDIITINRLHTLPFAKTTKSVELEVSRISVVSIDNNWLSIIIDGNGNGFDFQMVGNKEEIDGHFKKLLNGGELNRMSISYI